MVAAAPTVDELAGELVLWQDNVRTAQQVSGTMYGPLEACSSETNGTVRYWLEWRVPVDEVDIALAQPLLLPHTRAKTMLRALTAAVKLHSSTMQLHTGCRRHPAHACIAPGLLHAIDRLSNNAAWYFTVFGDFALRVVLKADDAESTCV